MESRNKKNKALISAQLADVGKMPPQAVELEEGILGAVMLDPNSIIFIGDFLRPEMFYKDSHERIFKAVLTLHEKSDPVDILTVTQELKRTGELDMVGGAFYISHLTDRVAGAGNIEFHSRIVQQKYIQREAIRICSEIIQESYEEKTDIFQLLDKSLTGMMNLMQGVMKRSEQGTAKMAKDFMDRLDKVANSESSITGVPTTLSEVDRIIRGYQPSDLIIVAGRPGMGKTAYTKSVINGAVEKWKVPILVFSMEMSTQQNIARIISERVGIPASDFDSKEFLKNTSILEVQRAFNPYFDKDGKDLLIIDDSPTLSINELKARAKLMYSKYKICAVVVDYLQMVSAPGYENNKVYELEEVAKGLKQLAKELNIPVLALCMLNRDVEKNENKRPLLSNLRSSGAIEQFADIVEILYRPEYYKNGDGQPLTWPDGSSAEGQAEIIIAKHRNGALADIRVKFIDRLTKFENYDPSSPGTNPYSTSANTGPDSDGSTIIPAHLDIKNYGVPIITHPKNGEENLPF